MLTVVLTVFCATLLAGHASQAQLEETELRMPGVEPQQPDTYLCKSVQLDAEQDHYLVGFTPHGSMKTAHHMLLYGCSLPGSAEEAWNCGEMNSNSDNPQYKQGPVCAEGAQIIYAWAKDAPELKLPKDVGFKVGGASPIKYLVLQVHYMHAMPQPDYSGITLHSTDDKMPKRAGVLLMVTGGGIQSGTTDDFETACTIDENVELHPFAFRTHTHQLGKVVSGWKVQHESAKDKWTLIGKKSPQLPQMFYPVEDPQMTIKEGDIVAARCHMTDNTDNDVYIGSTGADEMCNFYMMYYVNGDRILSDNTCYSPGPPEYYWAKQGGLNNIPDKQANTL